MRHEQLDGGLALLAGGNDMGLLERTGIGRDINRHYYTPAEIAAELERPVVQTLLALSWTTADGALVGWTNTENEDLGAQIRGFPAF